MPSNPPQTIDRSLALLTSFVYFVQGALGIAGVAFLLFLREKGWGISEIASFSFIASFPWTLKVIYGAVSDGVPIRGLRRKPYVLLASLLSFGSWLGFGLFPENVSLLYLFSVAANLGFAVTDVVTDALVVEESTDSTAQIYQSLAWGFRSLGAVMGGVLGGWLAQNFPYQWIFAITAVLPMTTLIAGTFLRESPRPMGERRPHLLLPITQSLRVLFRGDLKWFSAFLVVSSFSASFGTPFFFFLKEKLGFSETFLGLLSSLTWLGAIGGCLIYGRLVRDVSIKKSLCWAVWLNTINVLSTYFVLNRMSAVTLSFLAGILGYLSLLPLMGAAALLSREKGIEGSLFALLMSVYNLGQILSAFLGGKLFDIIGLQGLIVLSAGVGLTGLAFVARLRTDRR